jgi:3-oxoadipate enol-lactonase
MPLIRLGEYSVNYALTGTSRAPVLVLSNSLGATFSMWDPQLAEFDKHFRVLRYDTRGHGGSAVTPGPYSLGQLGGDVVALLDALKIQSAYFCGLSLGGLTGLWLGTHAAARLRRLVVSSASAKFGTAENWEKRIAAVRQGDMKLIAPQVVERWYTSDFRKRAPETIQAMQQMLESISADGYVNCCAALRDADMREEISDIAIPTLVISGTQDPVSPPADGQFIANKISGAKYHEVDAAHLLTVEAAGEFTEVVLRFLTAEGAGDD